MKRRSGSASRMAERRTRQPHLVLQLRVMRAQGMPSWAAFCILFLFSFFIVYGGFRVLGLELP